MSGQRYFVTGMQRSGTSVIHNGLRGHPKINAFKQEIGFDRFFRQGASYFCWGRDLDERERREAPAALFDALAGLGASDETEAFGIKCLMFNPAHAREFVQDLSTHFPDSLVVRVRRDDWVAQFGSLVKARKTDIWQRKGGSFIKARHSKVDYISESKNSIKNTKISIDKYKFLDYVIQSHKIEKAIDKIEKNRGVCEVKYERDIKDKNLRDVSNFDQLYDFLNVDPVPPKWIQMQKLSPPPEEYITNYQRLSKLAREVRDELAAGVSSQAVRKRHGRPVTRRVADSIRWHVRHPSVSLRRIWDEYLGA